MVAGKSRPNNYFCFAWKLMWILLNEMDSAYNTGAFSQTNLRVYEGDNYVDEVYTKHCRWYKMQQVDDPSITT